MTLSKFSDFIYQYYFLELVNLLNSNGGINKVEGSY